MPHIDLDSHLAAKNQDPFYITFRGKRYEGPAEMPWAAVSMAQDIHGEEVSMEQVGEVIALILGPEAWQEMKANGLGFESSMMILNGIMDHYMSAEALQKLSGDADPKEKLKEMWQEMEAKEKASQSPSTTAEGTSEPSASLAAPNSA